MLLSEIELRVAELAAHGAAVTVIGETLGVSPDAVAEYLACVYRKLGGAPVCDGVSPMPRVGR